MQAEAGETFDVRHGPVHLPLRVEGGVAPFELWYYRFGGARWVAAVMGEPGDGPFPLRIESACILGHVFHSAKCDCGFQLDEAMRRIARVGRGVVVYGVDQDARGLGVESHFHIYVLRQQENLDTEDVYRRLDAPLDVRDYTPVAHILRDRGVSGVRLMSNNPGRRAFLEEHGFDVEVWPIEAELDEHNISTLMLEKEDLGYAWSFRTHGDWLQPMTEAVDGHPERRRARLVEGTHRELAAYGGEGWEPARGLARAVAEAGVEPEGGAMRVVYCTDLPRRDELPLYAAMGARFVVVPFLDLPDWVKAAAAEAGVRMQDWERHNGYAQPRPQWHWRGRRDGLDVYARGDAVRVYGEADAIEAHLGRVGAKGVERGAPEWFQTTAADDAEALERAGLDHVDLGDGRCLPWPR